MYQGRWNAAFRDMESEIIPMCEDQGMAIVSWASLGGGQLLTADQRKKIEEDPNAGKGYYTATEDDIKVCDVLEKLAKENNTTLQAIVSGSCPPSHSNLTFIGAGIPLSPVYARLPNSRSPNGRARQSSTRSLEYQALDERYRRHT